MEGWLKGEVKVIENKSSKERERKWKDFSEIFWQLESCCCRKMFELLKNWRKFKAIHSADEAKDKWYETFHFSNVYHENSSRRHCANEKKNSMKMHSQAHYRSESRAKHTDIQFRFKLLCKSERLFELNIVSNIIPFRKLPKLRWWIFNGISSVLMLTANWKKFQSTLGNWSEIFIKESRTSILVVIDSEISRIHTKEMLKKRHLRSKNN
jgi:hypothetical protein